jgi:hypothetical protein
LLDIHHHNRFQVFRIFKLARILKLGRHSPGLQSIAYTLKHSVSELGLMLGLILISGTIFASLCFFIEQGEADSGYTSIPTGIYWVIITMTTVGYGDISPTSPLGKVPTCPPPSSPPATSWWGACAPSVGSSSCLSPYPSSPATSSSSTGTW